MPRKQVRTIQLVRLVLAREAEEVARGVTETTPADASSALRIVTNDAVTTNATTALRAKACTIFVYLAYTFSGQAYPAGALEPSVAADAKQQLYNLLFSMVYLDADPLQDRSAGLPYPYLRTLARFDAVELMRTLTVAFRDASLDGTVVLTNALDHGAGTPLDRQMVIDILLRVANHTSGEFPVRR